MEKISVYHIGGLLIEISLSSRLKENIYFQWVIFIGASLSFSAEAHLFPFLFQLHLNPPGADGAFKVSPFGPIPDILACADRPAANLLLIS